MSINYPAQHYICTPTLWCLLEDRLSSIYTTQPLYLLQPDQNFLMKVKVEDLEGLLTQKHGVIVMKVKVEDLEGLGGQSRAGQRTGL